LFNHPDLDAEEPGFATDPRGRLELVEDRDCIRQALLLLLSTRPGERVMRPEYGCDLHRLVFSPNDGTTAGLAIHYVRRAIMRWEQRVEIIDIDAGPHPDQADFLNIVLNYRVRATQRTDTLQLPVQLTGER
jgi:phage baseplate assembly protein W